MLKAASCRPGFWALGLLRSQAVLSVTGFVIWGESYHLLMLLSPSVKERSEFHLTGQ